MSTPANNAINALLADSSFNTLVANLKSKRDEIAGYQYSINSYQSNLTALQNNLTAAQADEVALQQQIVAAGAALIASQLPQ